MGLAMTDVEIRDSFRTAADRAAQINILAELNGMSGPAGRRLIMEALIRAGVPRTEIPAGAVWRRLNSVKAQELYDRGLNDAEIAEELFSTPAGVCQWGKRRGLSANAPRGFQAKEAEEAEEPEELFSSPGGADFFDYGITRDMKMLLDLAAYCRSQGELDLVKELMSVKMDAYIERKMSFFVEGLIETYREEGLQ